MTGSDIGWTITLYGFAGGIVLGVTAALVIDPGLRWTFINVTRRLRHWARDLFRDDEPPLSDEAIDEEDERLFREINAMRRHDVLQNVRPVSPEVEARIKADFDRVRNVKPLRVVPNTPREVSVKVEIG